MKKIITLLLAISMLFCIASVAYAADIMESEEIDARQALPEWLPDDAPEPHPDSTISVVEFYIDNNGKAVIYEKNPYMITPNISVIGNFGTAAIYFTSIGTVFWGVGSHTKGPMSFSGYIASNNSIGKPVGGSSGTGYVSSLTGIYCPKGKTTTATLSGVMVDLQGISFTLPGIQASIYNK